MFERLEYGIKSISAIRPCPKLGIHSYIHSTLMYMYKYKYKYKYKYRYKYKYLYKYRLKYGIKSISAICRCPNLGIHSDAYIINNQDRCQQHLQQSELNKERQGTKSELTCECFLPAHRPPSYCSTSRSFVHNSTLTFANRRTMRLCRQCMANSPLVFVHICFY